jgi:hypothetical protein
MVQLLKLVSFLPALPRHKSPKSDAHHGARMVELYKLVQWWRLQISCTLRNAWTTTTAAATSAPNSDTERLSNDERDGATVCCSGECR